MGEPLEIVEDAPPLRYNESHIMELCLSLNLSDIVENNLTEICSSSQARLPTSLMAIIQIFYAVVCLVGLCGNSLVIYVVLRYSKMQTVTYIYILMLAVADEIFLLGIPFLIVTFGQGEWIFGMAMCKIYMTTTSINQFTSSIFLMVLSADRYIAVCHPISAPKYRTPVIARCVSLTAWAVSALFMVPVFMYAATITKAKGGQSCNIFWPFGDEEETAFHDGLGNVTTVASSQNVVGPPAPMKTPHIINGQTAFTFYSFVLGFAIPLILILIFYAQVVFKLRTVGPKSNSAAVNGKSKGRKKSHAKVTRLVLTVITVYILCWLPYWITQLALIFTPPGHNQDKVVVAVMLLAGCLSYSNSAMNPVLYAFLSDNFKKSFMKACTCAARGDANAALQVEHSLFPRKRTLLSRVRGQDKNAAKNRLIQQAKDANKLHNNLGNGSSGQGGSVGGGKGMNAGQNQSHNDKIHELNDVSTGVSMSRTSRSCFNSTAGPTGATTMTGVASASVSVAHTEEEPQQSPRMTTVNGTLAPPPKSTSKMV